jgi:hypothetical protein
MDSREWSGWNNDKASVLLQRSLRLGEKEKDDKMIVCSIIRCNILIIKLPNNKDG